MDMAHQLPVEHADNPAELRAVERPRQAGSAAQRVLSWEAVAWTSRADC